MTDDRPNTTQPVDWDTLPDLLFLDEVVAITRHSIKTAYNLLATQRFPIAPLPNAKPFRFPKARVRAWVEHGTVSNKSLAAEQRRPRRRRPAA
jgi:predicted DNA-binding transcriptional regulator AlpA